MSDYKIRFRDPQSGRQIELEAERQKTSWNKTAVAESFNASTVENDGTIDVMVSEGAWSYHGNHHFGIAKESMSAEDAAALKRALDDPNSASLRVFDLQSGRALSSIRGLRTDAAGELSEVSENLDASGARREVRLTPSGQIATPDGNEPATMLEVGDGLFRAASLIDDVKENLFDEIGAPESLKEKMFQNLVEAMDAVAPGQVATGLDAKQSLQLRSSTATTMLELMTSQNLWERRLLSRVTSIWGFSPFSSILRFYNGLGSFIASFSFFRARTSIQMALIGAMQGGRWLKSMVQEQEAESNLDRISTMAIDDNSLREAQLVVDGYIRDCGLRVPRGDDGSLELLRRQAARMETQFLGDAGRRVDEIIDRQALKHSGSLTRFRYELLFIAYIAFILFRVGKNFFYDSFAAQWVDGSVVGDVELLSTDFYIPAAIFFLLWSGLLVMAFTRRLRRGLTREIDELARQLAENRISRGLFPDLEKACREFDEATTGLQQITVMTSELQQQIAGSIGLGGLSAARPERTAASSESR